MTKFDALIETLAERKEVQDVHDAAIEALATRLTILETRTDTSKKLINETLAVILSIISLMISAIGGATFIIWHPR